MNIVSLLGISFVDGLLHSFFRIVLPSSTIQIIIQAIGFIQQGSFLEAPLYKGILQ